MKPGAALRRGPQKPPDEVVEVKAVAPQRPHLRREEDADHTLCGYPITPATTTYTVREAMTQSNRGNALPICAACISRFQRIRA